VLLHVKVDTVVLGEGLLKELCEFVVILGVHGIASHRGVFVGYTREADGQEAEFLVHGEGVIE